MILRVTCPTSRKPVIFLTGVGEILREGYGKEVANGNTLCGELKLASTEASSLTLHQVKQPFVWVLPLS